MHLQDASIVGSKSLQILCASVHVHASGIHTHVAEACMAFGPTGDAQLPPGAAPRFYSHWPASFEEGGGNHRIQSEAHKLRQRSCIVISDLTKPQVLDNFDHTV